MLCHDSHPAHTPPASLDRRCVCAHRRRCPCPRRRLLCLPVLPAPVPACAAGSAACARWLLCLPALPAPPAPLPARAAALPVCAFRWDSNFEQHEDTVNGGGADVEGPEATTITCTVSMGTQKYVFRKEFHRADRPGPDGHRAERDPNQSFRTMYFIFPHSAGAFGGGGGNITPQV